MMTRDFQVLLEVSPTQELYLELCSAASPLSTVAPNQNKASRRLRSPAVTGWERPNLGYKYAAASLYLAPAPF